MNGFSFFGQQNTYPCVVSVVENSPADKAGIQVNDIITAVDGNSVSSGEALSIMINSYNIGDQITLTIKRGNSSVSISVTLEERISK
nr:PDZ domain-containing protein [Eubacteriales bacterium]